jgi:hypothetical protein
MMISSYEKPDAQSALMGLINLAILSLFPDRHSETMQTLDEPESEMFAIIYAATTLSESPGTSFAVSAAHTSPGTSPSPSSFSFAAHASLDPDWNGHLSFHTTIPAKNKSAQA